MKNKLKDFLLKAKTKYTEYINKMVNKEKEKLIKENNPIIKEPIKPSEEDLKNIERKGSVEEKAEKKVEKKAEGKVDKKENEINYWMLTASPDKWFGDKSKKNSKVNKILKDLTFGEWEVNENTFKKIKAGDKGIIKIGNDTRTKERRTSGKTTVDKLEQGIYAIVEFIEKENEIIKEGKVSFKVIKNLFKENKIINKEKSEEILKKDFKAYKSKEITAEEFKKIEAL